VSCPHHLAALLSLIALLPVADVAFAAEGVEVPSVFFIAKSENKNQVHYGLHLAADCTPATSAPAFGYWRMLERGPTATEPLLSMEAPAYGFARQRVVYSGPDGGRVVVALRALPDRPIVVSSWRGPDGCAASAETDIGGAPAVLTRVFVQLRWPFGVESITLDGYATADRHAVRERVAK
jgi:hypothetical protein